MTPREAADYAVTLFNEGYNCSESTLMAALRFMGVEDAVPSPRIATALGAGFGRAQLSCGILTGGVMALGLKFGRDDASQSREEAYAKAREYTEAFERLGGSPNCRDLTGLDMRNPDQAATMRTPGGAHECVCVPLMRRAVEGLCRVLGE